MGYRNVLDLDVAGVDGNRASLAGPGIALNGTIKEASGRRAAAAIRPEEVVVVDPSTPAANAIDATVEMVEYGGRESLLDTITASGQRFYVRTDANVQAGQAVKLVVPVERVLVYPSDTAAATTH
jgi:putative spermidine/putrescine transport system ATP-binding protein